MAYKRNKQAEDDLGRRIDQIGVQISEVSNHVFVPAALMQYGRLSLVLLRTYDTCISAALYCWSWLICILKPCQKLQQSSLSGAWLCMSCTSGASVAQHQSTQCSFAMQGRAVQKHVGNAGHQPHKTLKESRRVVIRWAARLSIVQ